MDDERFREKRATDRGLIVGGLLILVVGGVIGMYLIYGPIPAAVGAAVLIGGMAIFLLLWGLLTLAGHWANPNR
ncbi:MAG: hypothetical protein NZ518_12015 [Dehalococcoidia bacterium]|nr:hypothetical protein [Dehalococcoidia bacterium]